MKIAFVTQAAHPEIEADDHPLAEALARRGALVLSASWDDPDFEWSRIDCALVRSPWDYFRRYDEFLSWLGRVEKVTKVINPPAVVRWNANKRYLSDLASRGAPVVPTVFVARHQAVELERLCGERGWTMVVLKPAVSADSWETIRVEPARDHAGQTYLERHRPEREIMVQPFVRDVEEGGEQCLVFFGGRYSHAVTKNSAFRGGRHVGPEGRLVEAAPDAIDMAQQVLGLAEIPEIPYARVDIARDEGGRPILLELELFEPTLFFLTKAGSAERLADVLLQ